MIEPLILRLPLRQLSNIKPKYSNTDIIVRIISARALTLMEGWNKMQQI